MQESSPIEGGKKKREWGQGGAGGRRVNEGNLYRQLTINWGGKGVKKGGVPGEVVPKK